MVFAAVTFALVAYLVISETGLLAVKIILAVIFALLALRASGLQRAELETDAQQGHLSVKTEFEGPEDPDRNG